MNKFDIQCKDADDFLDKLRLSNPMWLSAGEYKSSWVFRGQADARWHLLPKAVRKGQLVEKLRADNHYVVKKVPTTAETSNLATKLKVDRSLIEDRLTQLYRSLQIEFDLVQRFVDLADQTGLVISSHEPRLLDGSMFNSSQIFTYDMGYMYYPYIHVGGLARDHIRTEYMLAQHHGIPTRLVDWTYNSLVAAYFASSDEYIHTKNPDTFDIAVWALNLNMLNKFNLDIDKPYNHRVRFLQAQDGLFSFDINLSWRFLSKGKWFGLNQLRKRTKEPSLRRISVSAQYAQEVLRLLSAERINEPYLKPTFDNVGKEILKQVKQEFNYD